MKRLSPPSRSADSRVTPAAGAAGRSPRGWRKRALPLVAPAVAVAAGLWLMGAAGQATVRPDALPDGGDPRRSFGADRVGPADRTFLNDTVVRVETKAVGDAESSRSLGERRSGTGVLLDRSTVLTIGYLLIEVDEVLVATPSGKRIPGSVAGYDPVSGFGIVRTAVPLDGRPLELGDSDAIGEKERVLTLGHGEPEATELLVVSRKAFTGSWEYQVDNGIFTFPPVNNWSGAALVDRNGKLVGIGSLIVNDAATAQRGVPGNFYVPTNLLKPILADLLATGRRSGPAQPWLGITTEVVQGNLMVARVSPGGPAERAGLGAGDIIVAVDGEKVASQADFYRIVWKKGAAGVTVPLRVLKSGDVREIAVKSVDRMESLRKPTGI